MLEVCVRYESTYIRPRQAPTALTQSEVPSSLHMKIWLLLSTVDSCFCILHGKNRKLLILSALACVEVWSGVSAAVRYYVLYNTT